MDLKDLSMCDYSTCSDLSNPCRPVTDLHDDKTIIYIINIKKLKNFHFQSFAIVYKFWLSREPLLTISNTYQISTQR